MSSPNHESIFLSYIGWVDLGMRAGGNRVNSMGTADKAKAEDRENGTYDRVNQHQEVEVGKRTNNRRVAHPSCLDRHQICARTHSRNEGPFFRQACELPGPYESPYQNNLELDTRWMVFVS